MSQIKRGRAGGLASGRVRRDDARARDQEIRDTFAARVAARDKQSEVVQELATRYGISDRHIRRILQELPIRDPQPSRATEVGQTLSNEMSAKPVRATEVRSKAFSNDMPTMRIPRRHEQVPSLDLEGERDAAILGQFRELVTKLAREHKIPERQVLSVVARSIDPSLAAELAGRRTRSPGR